MKSRFLRHGAGTVIFVNASADRAWGKWQTAGTLFVVTMHVLAARAAERDEDRWRNCKTQGLVGKDLTLTLSERFRNRELSFNGQTVTANERAEFILQLPGKPGFYPLIDEKGTTTRLLAVNLPPEESNLQSVQAVVVQRQLERLRKDTEGVDPAFLKKSSAGEGSLLWRTALVLLALLLAGETLIGNRVSGESVVSGAKAS